MADIDPSRAGAIELVGLTHGFISSTAVGGLDLTIRAGEFFSLLGPAGCGKTTALRMIAGLEEPSGGRILIDGEDMTDTPTHRRPVNTVFHSYALFPFLDVAANVAFGLRYQRDRGAPGRAETAARVRSALAMVQMTEYARRRPAQLSGGQQQRVALARALVLRPRVLLLDEPLGPLAGRLREALRADLRALQRQVGITFLYATRHRDEALALSDRLAVMDGGQIAQIGAPGELETTIPAEPGPSVPRESAVATGVRRGEATATVAAAGSQGLDRPERAAPGTEPHPAGRPSGRCAAR